MSTGTLIRIAECIVTIWCGVILAVRPAKMRWNHIAAKIIFCVLIFGGMVYESANVFWFKFSSVHTLLLAIFLFVVLFIFFRIHFLQLLVQNFFYWYTLILGRIFVISICCMMSRMGFSQYITGAYGVPWHWFHILGMLAAMGISVLLVYVRRGKALIVFRSRKDYFWILLFLFCEEIINEAIFTSKNLNNIVSGTYLITSGLILWLLTSMIIIFQIYRMYMYTNEKEQIMKMNMEMLREQHTMLQDIYTEKRIQVHDAVNHDILLIQYLREGRSKEALEYLEEKLEKTRSGVKKEYTGIQVIDLMLDYKIRQAEKQGIRIELKGNVYFCPLQDAEMCVVLGNLMNNAIEAAGQLPLPMRRIEIFMSTPNSIFLLQIKNPYEGKRKKADGHYVTTKPDKELHGLGLKSVEQIISKYNGTLEVADDEGEFSVLVTVFGVQGQ